MPKKSKSQHIPAAGNELQNSTAETPSETVVSPAPKPPAGKKATGRKPAAKKKSAPAAAAKRSAAEKIAGPTPAAAAAAPPPAAPPVSGAEAPAIREPSDAEISLRAYFIAEHRARHSLPGDPANDWIEARAQLLAEAQRRA